MGHVGVLAAYVPTVHFSSKLSSGRIGNSTGAWSQMPWTRHVADAHLCPGPGNEKLHLSEGLEAGLAGQGRVSVVISAVLGLRNGSPLPHSALQCEGGTQISTLGPSHDTVLLPSRAWGYPGLGSLSSCSVGP